MEAIVQKKTAILERLVGLSTDMLFRLDHADFDSLDDHLQKRSALLTDLQYFDQLLQGQPTEKDASWLKQLEWLKQADQDIQSRVRTELERVTQGLRQGQREKEHLLQMEMNDGKGQSLHVKA